MSRTLSEWLDYIERTHPAGIELGLERVARVRDALGLSFAGPIITVGGTNGKGSTCAMLDAILRAEGYRVGLYTSPHLLHFNERVRLSGVPVSDGELVLAFEAVEQARGDTPLTYFEFGTLAAWHIFATAPLDALVLEVGLGGRLDAVNAFEPDCAIVTRVSIDHVDYLGSSRESIGAEKAGIFRAGKPAICADPCPPGTLVAHAQAIGADLQQIGRDFSYVGGLTQWRFNGRSGSRAGLAPPALRGATQLANAAACLAALDAMSKRLPVSMQAVRLGLATVELPGRFQVLPGRPSVVLDVAHNPDAAATLAANLSDMGFYPETHAVIGMLRDKDIEGVCRAVKGSVSAWLACDLPGPRAATAAMIQEAIAKSAAGAEVSTFPSPRAAYAEARRRAGENDRILVFGSFLTVADVMAATASDTGG
ncbi:MAG: bifunctional folylpolyglutamate synthase/dihydrofolate synthase [Betaproteobacteria bacterium RIFCSPLOWO2_12_FULL_66_14]|nr:MAG: bifunctional folylpolyglutamate synthase/dihydrofolate synthase [Betaproteobacteria bacterium RIFCSPLOWO2_12_FULL_66_14]